MRHKLLLLFLFVYWMPGMSFAQTGASATFIVKGVLVDSLTQEGEPYATLKIVKKNAPDKPLKMAVTDGKGKFQEKIPALAGDYILTISSVGRTPVLKDFSYKVGEKVVDLGTLYSVEATNELQGVVVTAQKPLVKVDVDKIDYNIEDDPDSKTNNILEMLRKVPLVTVDGEDNIQVNGSSSFKIHVNGKPNNMMSKNPKEVLKSMPANSIKRIEVITSPGAKYDAEGIGGILNIITVGGGFEGYTATLSANASNNGVGGSAYATVKKSKLTVSANYSYNYSNRPRSYSDSYRENFESEDEKYLESTSSSKYKSNFQYGNLEASYEIDTLRLITMAVGMYGNGGKGNNDGSTTMYNALRDKLSYGYGSFGNSKSSWHSIFGNIDYQRVSKKNKDRMFTFSYKIDTSPESSESYTTYEDFKSDIGTTMDEIVERLRLKNYHSKGNTNTAEHTFQADYTTPIGKLHTLETGVKYILRRNTSDDQFYEALGGHNDYQYSEDRSSNYKHLNHIVAAYASYTLKYKGFSFRPGVRYEHTKQDVKFIVGPGENFGANFNDFVPSVSLGTKIGKTQNLRFNYNMRIYRPGIWYLNPYFDNRDPMFVSQGNPDLDSEKSHSFDLSYSSFSTKFNINLSLRYGFNNNGIENISRLITEPNGENIDGDPNYHLPEGALYSTYKNIGKDKNAGLSLYLGWNPTSKTRISLNGRGAYRDVKSPEQGLHNYGWTGSLYGGVQQTIPFKIRLSLNGGGSTPYINLQGKGSGYFYYSFSINRSFLKEDRLSVGAYCSNVFEKYRSYNNTTIGTNFLSKNWGRYPSRSFGFNISYRFGSLKASVKKTSKSIDNDDVKGGGGNSGGDGGK